MKVELQGEGTFDYECHDPDCFYCQHVGIYKDIVEFPLVLVLPSKVNINRVDRDAFETLSAYQRRKRREVFWIRPKVGFMKLDQTY